MNGLHWAPGGIAFLIQGPAFQTAGEWGIECPFPLETTADHAIDLKQALVVDGFPTDPLVDAMSPIPCGTHDSNVQFLRAGPNDKLILATLARMSSPIRLPIRPFWSMRAEAILRELERTNVQPLVLTDIKPADRPKLDRVVDAALTMPRKLVLHGDDRITLRRWVTARNVPTWHITDVVALPWEAYGASLLRNHMLRKTP